MHSSRQSVVGHARARPSPNNRPFAWGSVPHLIRGSLGPPDLVSQRHLDRFSRFCTAHSRKSLHFAMDARSRPKLPLPTGDLHPRLTHDSLVHPTPQPKRQLDQFSRFCTVSLYFSMGRPSPFKIAPTHRGCKSPSNMVPRAHLSHQLKRYIDRFSHFCRAHYCD